jgi:glycosyltransferase involved in cell wall biosynthesis
VSLRVFISPNPREISDDNGVGKVVHAQFRYLPEFGIELVSHPEQADVIASHVYGDYLPRLDVLHLHGLYFDGDPGSGHYLPVHLAANARIAESCRRARHITMPSRWAGECLRRDMRIEPVTIPNGVDFDLWQDPGAKNMGYALWNKNRAGDVCDPGPAYELARRGVPVAATFAPDGVEIPENMHVLGKLPFEAMRKLILTAGVFLSTTKECFSLSVLEALASGVPVLGYDWGGTPEAVRHKVEGYLVRPGDLDGLAEGWEWIKSNRQELGAAAKERAKAFEWKAIIEKYAALYRLSYEQRQRQQHRVAAVITSYNYAKFLPQAIESALNQSRPPDQIIVVDDASTDNSFEVLKQFEGKIEVIRHETNKGVAAARNTGIRAADCEYCICLDADDQLATEYVETLVEPMVGDPALGVAWSKVALTDEQGNRTGDVWDFDYKWEDQAHPDPATGGIRNGIPAGAMFRRAMWEKCGGYKQVYHPAEDAEFWLRGLSTGFTARRVVDNPLFLYRQHTLSASRTRRYPPIHTWHPWATDRQYPFAAPASKQPPVRSYSRPLISVVVPVGPGHESYLPTALESLLAQSFRDWEVIVVDDTAEGMAISALARTYPFVKYVATEGRKGAGAARNRGLGQVKTPLVLFLDADDYLLPTALEKMLRFYLESGGKYVYTDWLAVTDKIEEKQVPEYSQAEWLKNGLHAVTVLMPAEDARRVGGFDEKLTGWEDWEFFIKCAYAGICGARLPETLLAYRLNTGQRRERSQKLQNKLMATFRKRYEGRIPMGCGCNQKTLEEVSLAATLQGGSGLAAEPGFVTLEFTGPQTAPFTRRVKGASYTVANADGYKYHRVPVEDAGELLSYGDFQIAGKIGALV